MADDLALDDAVERRRAEIHQRLSEATERAYAQRCFDFAFSEWPDAARAERARLAEENFENACADYIATGRGLEAMQKSWKAFLEACRIPD